MVDDWRDLDKDAAAGLATPATSGHVTGVATRLFGGRNIATYQIEITDEQGGLVCTSRLTCLLRDSARDRADGPV